MHLWVWQYQTIDRGVRGYGSTSQGYVSVGVAVPNRGVYPWVWQYQTEVCIRGCGITRQRCVSVGVTLPDRGLYPWV